MDAPFAFLLDSDLHTFRVAILDQREWSGVRHAAGAFDGTRQASPTAASLLETMRRSAEREARMTSAPMCTSMPGHQRAKCPVADCSHSIQEART
jgi:hypothetical protein